MANIIDEWRFFKASFINVVKTYITNRFVVLNTQDGISFENQFAINPSNMKYFLQIFFISILINACGSSKNYLERTDEDKALQDVVKKLNKNATDEDATYALPILYSSILKTHKAKIKSFESGNELNRWDKIIGEYNSLQDAYDVIINSTPAFKLVTPENFSSQLMETKESAAEDYYLTGESFLAKSGRENAKQAYTNFKKADKYVPGYKEVQDKINESYENAIINVIINPVQDNSYFNNSGWGNSGYDYSNEYFQRTLVRDLAYNNNNNTQVYAAKFYSDWEARRENIQPNWIVDLSLSNINLPQPSNYNYRQNRSSKVQSGTDTLGKPVFTTVSATLNVTRRSFTANARMDVLIKDMDVNKTINNQSFSDDYKWQQEKATYSGDSRALSATDWEMINNNNYNNTPRREDVLNELYKKIYPRVLNEIKYAVSW